MKIHPFIFTWPGQDPSPTIRAWESLFGSVTVINSSEPREGWVNLGADAYFTEQWLTALELFKGDSGDILFHCQADATCSCWPKVVERSLELHHRYQWDNFAPFVDYTYHTRTIDEIEDRVFRVPVNDCTCWMLHKSLIDRYLALDVDWRANRFGWGHDLVMGALADLAIRDHTVTVDHPRHTGYPRRDARNGCRKMLDALPSELRAKITFR